MTNRPLRVFLCHSSNDKPAVRELYQKLHAEPWIQPWLDEEELYPGQDWETEIEKAVGSSDVVLVCLSNSSINKRGFVQKELRFALDIALEMPEETIFIIPLRLEECTPPRSLREWQYADYFEGRRERALERLLVSLSRRAKSVKIHTEKPKLDRQEFDLFPNLYDEDSSFQSNISAIQIQDISSLIAQGESEMLEFKSSIRYDYKLQSTNQDVLGLVIAKTLAGFMNRVDGILLIGVSHDGQILGIEKDLETLTKKNLDGFANAFFGIVYNYIGNEYLKYLHMEFKDLNAHKVCVIQIKKSQTPVYVKNGKTTEFYIRTLTSTHKLSLPETVKYIRSQWG